MSIEDNNETKPLDQTTIEKIIQLNGSSSDFICRNNGIYHRFSISYYLFVTLSFIIFFYF